MATSVVQHPSMPCAKPFSSQYSYDQATHPATLLIYLSLGFVRTVDAYVWYYTDLSIETRLQMALEKMRVGQAVIGS